MFDRNIGAVDRVVRLIVGAALIAMVFIGPKATWGWVGIVPIVTALIRWCPLYRLFGLRTSRSGTANRCRR